MAWERCWRYQIRCEKNVVATLNEERGLLHESFEKKAAQILSDVKCLRLNASKFNSLSLITRVHVQGCGFELFFRIKNGTLAVA